MINVLIVFEVILGVSLVAYTFPMRKIMKNIKEELSDILISKGYTNPEGTELIKKPTTKERLSMIAEVISNSDKIKNKTLALRLVKLYNTACILTGVFFALVIYIVIKVL